jgi:hypothetical protein
MKKRTNKLILIFFLIILTINIVYFVMLSNKAEVRYEYFGEENQEVELLESEE